MTGPNRGKVYYLVEKRIIIGRSDSADIQIIDNKISREHAEVSFTGEGYSITDLGTPNGIVINDTKVVQKKLIDGEKIVIGQSVFKYSVIKISETNNMITIVKGEKVSIKPKQIISTIGTIANITGSSDDVQNGGTQKKPNIIIIIVIVVLVVFYLLDGQGNKGPNKTPARPKTSFDVSPEKQNKKTTDDDVDNKKRYATAIKEGQREMREGNSFRAIESFSHALQMMPSNGTASYYLSKAKQQMDDDIEKNFIKGNNEYESKKLGAAVHSFCAIEELLHFYPNDERFAKAAGKITAIEMELGKEKGEIKCTQETPSDK
jgi:pSer/pThr/pTyr-binding forkhead associated (FHA) protein